MPARVHQMLASMFPWVSLTELNTLDFVAAYLTFTPAPPFSLVFNELGYQTRNATANAGSVSTIILIPFLLTLLFFTFRACRNTKRLDWLYRIFMKKETLLAMWLRTSHLIFFELALIAL